MVLTFDDGPGNRLTLKLLKILDEYNAKATFFLLGKNIEGKEQIVKEIASHGHEIGSHGYGHLNYWKVCPFRAIKDIKRGVSVIERALGAGGGKYAFRPPYGKLNIISLVYLLAKKVPIYYWTLVSGDTWPADRRDSRRIASLAAKTGGAVALLHDFDRSTDHVDDMVLYSVRLALLAAKENGMRVVTVSELADNENNN